MMSFNVLPSPASFSGSSLVTCEMITLPMPRLVPQLSVALATKSVTWKVWYSWFGDHRAGAKPFRVITGAVVSTTFTVRVAVVVCEPSVIEYVSV